MSDKAPSAPSALPLTPPLGSLCSVRWLTASIRISIGHDLAEPLRRLLYQAPVSKHFLASAIVSGFVVCMWDGSPGGGCLWMAFPLVSVLLFVPVFPLDRSNFGLKFWRWVGGPIPQPRVGGGLPNLWIWFRPTGFPSPLWGISANVIPLGFWEALAFLASGTF